MTGLSKSTNHEPPHLIPQFGHQDPGAYYVFRPGGYAVILRDDREVAIVSTRLGWMLPGGGQDPGESPEAATVREVREECGFQIALISLLGVADELVYAAPEKTHFRKRCTFFLARVLGQLGEGEQDHPVIWVPIEEAVQGLRHESQRWALGQTKQKESK